MTSHQTSGVSLKQELCSCQAMLPSTPPGAFFVLVVEKHYPSSSLTVAGSVWVHPPGIDKPKGDTAHPPHTDLITGLETPLHSCLDF